MTNEVIQLIKGLNLDGKTLEVGSLDINGNVRSLFSDYTGIDIQAGPNVDLVASGHEIPFPDETFDTVLCLNTLEHDDEFWKTVAEMKRVLKPGGYLVIEVPNYRYTTVHNHPYDYYRFSREGVRKMFDGCNIIEAAVLPGRDDLTYGYGTKL